MIILGLIATQKWSDAAVVLAGMLPESAQSHLERAIVEAPLAPMTETMESFFNLFLISVLETQGELNWKRLLEDTHIFLLNNVDFKTSQAELATIMGTMKMMSFPHQESVKKLLRALLSIRKKYFRNAMAEIEGRD